MKRKKKMSVIDQVVAPRTQEQESQFRAATFTAHLCDDCLSTFEKEKGTHTDKCPALFRTLCDKCCLNLATFAYVFRKNINTPIPK